MYRRLTIAFVIAGLICISAPIKTLAAVSPVVDVDAIRGSVSEVPSLHCHDLDAPIIRCFRTEDALQVDVATRTLVSLDASASLPYVEIYEHTYYGGASFVVAQDYPNLGSIGWNDRVSLFRGLNNYYGTFYQHASYLGSYWRFGPNQQVLDVGTAWNDQFSSVARG